MNLKTLDTLLQRAVNLGLAFVMTASLLGGIDSLARSPQAQPQAHELAATAPAPRG